MIKSVFIFFIVYSAPAFSQLLMPELDYGNFFRNQEGIKTIYVTNAEFEGDSFKVITAAEIDSFYLHIIHYDSLGYTVSSESFFKDYENNPSYIGTAKPIKCLHDFDSLGRLIFFAIDTTDHQSIWANEHYYYYNKNGQLDSTIVDYYGNGRRKKYIYTYNDAGFMIRRECSSVHGGFFLAEYFYDSLNRIDSSWMYVHSSELHYYQKFKYYANSDKINTIQSWQSSTPDRTVIQTYSIENNLLSSCHYQIIGGALQFTSAAFNEYNSFGDKTCTYTVNERGEIGYENYWEYEYDKNGHWIRRKKPETNEPDFDYQNRRIVYWY